MTPVPAPAHPYRSVVARIVMPDGGAYDVLDCGHTWRVINTPMHSTGSTGNAGYTWPINLDG